MPIIFPTLAPTNNDNQSALLGKLVTLFGGEAHNSDNARALLARILGISLESLDLPEDLMNALAAANDPSVSNPFATMDDFPKVDVSFEGAVGDGVTNDRTALAAALAKIDSGVSNHLHFPSGTYRVSGNTASGGSYFHFNAYNLKLGASDLADRDIVISGDGATIFFDQDDQSSVACFWAVGNFRSLTIKGIRFERASTLRESTPGAEPNFNDLVIVTGYDTRTIEKITFEDCVFVNGHKSINLVGFGENRRDKVKVLNVERCQILNPYGANIDNSGGEPYGGGQQLSMDHWVHTANIHNNYFDGGADSYPVGTNPTGLPKDGGFFGNPRETFYSGNTCVNHGEETFFHCGNYTYMETISTGFTMPAVSANVAVTIENQLDTTFEVGQAIYVQYVGAFTVVSRVGATLTITNDGGPNNVAPATVISVSRHIYRDVPSESRATVTNNIFKKSPKLAIVSSVKSVIANNTITDNGGGITLYTAAGSADQDDCASSLIEGNRIELRDNSGGAEYRYGIRADSSERIIVNRNAFSIPSNVKSYGIYVRGDDWRVDNNQAFADVNTPQGRTGVNRGVGIAVQASGCVATGNFTGGWDVGIGNESPTTDWVLGVVHHEDTTSVLGVDPNNVDLTYTPRKPIVLIAHNNGVAFPVINWDTAYTDLNLSTAERNEGSWYNPATGIFTIPFHGLYEFGVMAEWTDNVSTSDLADIWIEDTITGRAATLFRRDSPVGSDKTWNGSTQIRLLSGSAVKLRITQRTGSTKNLNGASTATRIWGRMIS